MKKWILTEKIPFEDNPEHIIVADICFLPAPKNEITINLDGCCRRNYCK